MKRLSIFLVSSLAAIRISACCVSPYTPDDTFLYRIMEDTHLYEQYYNKDNRMYLLQKFDFRKENLKLWRKQIKNDINYEQLEQIIYGDAFQGQFNVFRLQDDANDCLSTAKNVQRIRQEMNDPWYFPSSRTNCGVYSLSLEELVDHCKEKMHGTFRGRYLLQALRCLNTLRRWDESIALWEQQRNSIPTNVIRTMAEREVAAAYLKKGQVDKAANIYAKIGDIASLRRCYSGNDEMTFVYEHCPNSPYFPEEIQAKLISFERFRYYYFCYGIDSEVNNFINLCNRVIYDKKVKNLAMWYYAIAATYDAKGMPEKAKKYLATGERLCKDKFLKKSFRILRLHLEVQTEPIDHAFENKLARELSWLCHEINNSLNKNTINILKNMDSYQTTANSCFWNDVMRRILLCDICPKLIKNGNTTRALQLANFADYYIIKKIDINTAKKIEWATWNGSSTWDYFTYSSSLFNLADSLSADELATYIRQQRKNKTNLDRLLASGSNMNSTFWHDIIGTHYLREYNYKKAITWLKTLPCNYERNTNIFREDKDYMKRDPFDMSISDPNYRRKRLNNTSNYKLNFARKMAKYEETMTKGKTKEKRAIAKLHYAIGKRNQHDYCWALTRYTDSNYFFKEYDDETNEYIINKNYADIKIETNKMIYDALNDMSKPLKARYLHAMHRNKEVMDECPETETAQYLRLVCDTWKNYVKQ